MEMLGLSPILTGLLVFFLRVIDMSLDTLRLLFVMRGKKLLAGLIGSTQAAVFIVAIGAVLRGPLNVWLVLGYAGGFGAGVILGIYLEQRLAIGFGMLEVFSAENGLQIVERLRDEGYAATISTASGMKGEVFIIHCAVKRKDINCVHDLITAVDPEAFITLDDVQPLHSGYFKQSDRRKWSRIARV
jgi:uncharacterized protein YebE (UPF0316 family)